MHFGLSDGMFVFNYCQINGEWNGTFTKRLWHILTLLNKWYLHHMSFSAVIFACSTHQHKRIPVFVFKYCAYRLYYVMRSQLFLNGKKRTRAAKLKAEKINSDKHFCRKTDEKGAKPYLVMVYVTCRTIERSEWYKLGHTQDIDY